MKECCDVVADISARQRRVLQVVLAINAAMFLVEFVAGLLAHSTALLADSVDMLGDAIVYGFSPYVVGRGAVWQGRGALLKGAIMAAFGVGVLSCRGHPEGTERAARRLRWLALSRSEHHSPNRLSGDRLQTRT
jgi:hypothetical protein